MKRYHEKLNFGKEKMQHRFYYAALFWTLYSEGTGDFGIGVE